VDSAGRLQALHVPAGRPIGVSVIVPTYNEAPNLPALLERLRDAFHHERLEYEVIIADDASPDGTAAVARRAASELSIDLRVTSRSGPRSLALSVVEAARAARHPAVVVLDADLSHAPEEAPALALRILEGDCDVAIASRYVPGGEMEAWSLRRRLLSAAGTWAARRLVRARDPLSGYFACRRELLARPVGPPPRGFKVLLGLLLSRSGLRVLERPTTFRDRGRGSSKLGLRQQMDFLVQMAQHFLLKLMPSHSFPMQPYGSRRACP